MEIQNLYNEQKELLRKVSGLHFDKSYDKYQELVVDIFVNGTLSKITTEVIRYDIMGIYYYYILKDYKKAKKMWMMALDFGIDLSLCNLGNYYFNKKKYKQAKIYYLKSVHKGCDCGMVSLGVYYQLIEKNYKKKQNITFLWLLIKIILLQCFD